MVKHVLDLLVYFYYLHHFKAIFCRQPKMLEVDRSSVSHFDQMVVRVSPPHLCYILCCNYRGGGEKIRKKRAMDAEGQVIATQTKKHL